MWCGTSARARSAKDAASSTSRKDRPRSASRTTESATPSSSASPSGRGTKTGSPGYVPPPGQTGAGEGGVRDRAPAVREAVGPAVVAPVVDPRQFDRLVGQALSTYALGRRV